MLGLFRIVGSLTLGFLQSIGRFALFLVEVLKAVFLPPLYFRALLAQFAEIGYFSLPVVGLTAIFTGAVLALQTYTGFSRFSAESSIASVVVLSITRELGPVLAGLMLAGRVGAAIAAELGTMRVTEQIDALYTLNTDPVRYLVIPRVLAGLIMLPLLVLIADCIGVFGGDFGSARTLGFSPYSYMRSTFEFLELGDVTSGLIKAAAFGVIVTLIGSYNGYYSRGGAEGVGKSTTNAVVSASVLILVFNYLITGLLFGHNV